VFKVEEIDSIISIKGNTITNLLILPEKYHFARIITFIKDKKSKTIGLYINAGFKKSSTKNYFILLYLTL